MNTLQIPELQLTVRTIPERLEDTAAENGIRPQIPVRINFSGNSGGCVSRKEAGFMQFEGFDHIDKKTEHEFADLTCQQKRELQKMWRKESGYNDRWSVEIAFSTFKRMFGECMNARKWENVKTEIYGRVCLYNHMIDMATESGYGTQESCTRPGNHLQRWQDGRKIMT